ncbi:MAG: LON peptidase substrate-binding domain-containing protein [Candidatus Anammoxibacter sp.]
MLLDLFPLNSVVFPHQKLPLNIFEPRYLKLIESCHKESRAFGVCLIKEGKEVGAPAMPFKTGTSVVITEFDKISDTLLHIMVQGERRFKIKRFIQEQPHIRVEIEWLDVKTPDFPGNYLALRKTLARLINDKTTIPENDNVFFGFLGALISVNTQAKQDILEMPVNKVIPALTGFMESIARQQW